MFPTSKLHFTCDTYLDIADFIFNLRYFYLPPGGSLEREIMKCSLCVRAGVRASVSVSRRLL